MRICRNNVIWKKPLLYKYICGNDTSVDFFQIQIFFCRSAIHCTIFCPLLKNNNNSKNKTLLWKENLLFLCLFYFILVQLLVESGLVNIPFNPLIANPQNIQTYCFLRIWSHLLRKSLIENFIFCAVQIAWVHLINFWGWRLKG